MCKTTLKHYVKEAQKKEENFENEFKRKFSDLYYDKIFTSVRSFTNSTHDAEEITQSLFTNKFLVFPFSTFEKKLSGNFEAWVYVIVRDYCFGYSV